MKKTKIFFKCSNDNCTDDDVYRNTPLIYAARYGHVEVVRVLLEGGANIESATACWTTAVHLAAYSGHLDVCRLLLDWEAKVEPLNKWQYTPLHYAAMWGHLSVVKLLVERGADVSVKGYDGRNASDVAQWWGIQRCCRLAGLGKPSVRIFNCIKHSGNYTYRTFNKSAFTPHSVPCGLYTILTLKSHHFSKPH
jgi:hypothetical protein